MITCIPKEGKNKYLLKNWRPITLLNVDVKIASASLANRIKPFLKDIISETQQGFIKGRYIGECTRLIFDLLEKTEEDEIPGLLLLLDFEKAFDTLEWSFIDKVLCFLGFGSTFCDWVKALYSGAQSCIISNGHCSNFFDVKRGVRQGDPLSPYLFIIALEIMSAAMKNDPNINGIKIDQSEYLLSQYADDSSLLLDDDENSLKQSLYILEKFSECSGLRANLDKTEAIWVGSRAHSKEKLLPNVKLNWNQTGKFKLLGIKFDIFQEDKTLINFEEKIEKIKTLLNSWHYRDLTYLGKITVIKSLALPIIIQSLTVLPNPPVHIFVELQRLLFGFLWNKKPDKIKRNVIINPYEKGGLKMPHIPSFCFALKMTWIHKLLDPLNNSPWKILLVDQYEKFGGDKIWFMTREGLEEISSHFNSFWRDIFLNWSILCEGSTNTVEGVLAQPIWLNNFLRMNNKTMNMKRWIHADIFFVNDLLDESGEFMSYEVFKNKYNFNANFLNFLSVLHTIPQSWKDIILHSEKLTNITNERFEFVKKNKKSCQFFYKKYLDRYSEMPEKQQTKWCEDLNEEIEDWETIYQKPFRAVKNHKYIMFQFKIFHRILSTNSSLHKFGLKETMLCSFCNETKESILHLFCECSVVKNLWFEISELLKNKCNIDMSFTNKEIILGSDSENTSKDMLMILIKYYIYTCRFNGTVPCILAIISMLKHSYYIEKLSATWYRPPAIGDIIEKKWLPFKTLFET